MGFDVLVGVGFALSDGLPITEKLCGHFQA